MALLSLKNLKKEVTKIVGADCLRDIIKYTKEHLLTEYLYGDKKETPQYPVYYALLAIFKDGFAIGYDALRQRIPAAFQCSKESLLHNIQLARKKLYRYSKAQIMLGSISELTKKSRTVKLDTVPTHDRTGKTRVHLWIDSTDVRMIGRRSMSKKDSMWSYKENSPARRFMVLSDGHGSIQKIWGPYSPKTYDGDFLKMNSSELSTELKGTTVVADCHFEAARHKDPIPGVRFLSPYPSKKRGGTKRVADENGDLDQLQENYNKIVRNVRARVESPFGLIKQRFKALKAPFSEDDSQLKYLVTFASHVENCHVQE